MLRAKLALSTYFIFLILNLGITESRLLRSIHHFDVHISVDIFLIPATCRFTAVEEVALVLRFRHFTLPLITYISFRSFK